MEDLNIECNDGDSEIWCDIDHRDARPITISAWQDGSWSHCHMFPSEARAVAKWLIEAADEAEIPQ